MQRSLVFAVVFILFGTCWSVGQDVKNDSKPDNSVGFEGKVAGDRKELVPGIFFRWCPSGTFMMGSPEAESGRYDNEDQVSVTLTKGYWLGETEVTQGQWQMLMGTTPWKGMTYVKEGNDFAASFISWEDAVEFYKQLTSQERSANRLPQGWKYSLPTEAQWEYACRAGTTIKFSFGDDESKLGENGWFVENGYKVKEEYAHQVGMKESNAWGLKDMHGNVWEWCSDYRHGEKLSGGRYPAGRASGSFQVFRGGCWLSHAVGCRSAIRFHDSPWNRTSYIGFRLAAVPE